MQAQLVAPLAKLTIHITILCNYEDNFDTATTTTDKSMGFDTNAMLYPILTKANIYLEMFTNFNKCERL